MAHDGAAAATPLLASFPESAKPRRNMYPFSCAMLASMSTVLMGYNLAVLSGAEIFIREDLGLSDAEVEITSLKEDGYDVGKMIFSA
ncbi:hypothetical protein EJB05_26407 [Eragrostis curvula]|uniref:Major facilitator superfamily (MFS) profile domain-containing protein n=1 Tax=Eragrostis curvula TaxID=38414 RepID=A0A5J9UKS6_9POAL|nr:hypothetical protein EJB05_26407 [Eragrostis curvula]